jgi:hypothetical protein
MRALLMLAALLLASCADFVDAVGADEASLITVEAEIPAFVRLPQQALPASPVAAALDVTVPVPMDLVAVLREQGRNEEADLIEGERDRLEGVELREVEYEVGDPNLLPVAIEPVSVEMGPYEARTPEETWLLGRTVGVAAERTIATRELDYADGSLETASNLLESLRFTLLASTRLELAPGRPIPAEALKLRLTFKVRVRLSLTE